MHAVGVEDNDERSREIDDDGYDINWVKTYTSTDPVFEETDPFAKDFDFAKSLSGIHPNAKRSMAARANTLRKRYENEAGTEGSKRLEEQVITGYNAFGVISPPYNLDYLAKLYELSTPHKSSVDAKASNIVGLGYEFVPSARTALKRDGLTDVKKVEKFDKKLANAKIDLQEAIDEMNTEDGFVEILEKVWKDYETMGNGYIEIGRSEATGAIAYIGHLPAATVRVRRDRDGFVQIIANKAVFFRNFGKDDPNPLGGDDNPNEVIHIKKYSPSSTFYGVPDVVAAKTAVAGNDFSAKFNLDYFENKAVPRHVVILQGATINPRLAKNILEFFETGLKGKNHRSLFIPLPASTQEKKVELKIEPVEAGIQDASFNNYRKANIQEILMAHRVPINKIGLPEGVSLAVARDADKTFKEQVCGPEQDKLEKKLNKVLKDIQGESIFDISLNELTLTDEATQSQIDERRIKTGVEIPNEQRARRGQGPIKGGDERFDLNAKAAPAAGKSPSDQAGTTNRQRDAARSSGKTDSAGEGRNPKGEGRTNTAG